MNDKVLSFISLARKAGCVSCGELASEKSIKCNKAQLVIIARDASDNTKKHFKDMCAYRNVPYRFYGLKDNLGRACGKTQLSNIAVCNEGIAYKLIGLLAEVEN